MTLSKLSIRNAGRQANDYLVYFATIIMVAALMYAFNGLLFSQEIRNLSEALDSLPLIIVLVSVVVVCIIGWLVRYTIGFMLSRRSRELGTYILIGLENQQVARLFFLENLAVGGIALVIGLFFGNLVFQALRAVTLALFHVPYTFSFAFSGGAVGLTVFYFVLVYLLALLNGHKRIRNMKISDLIYFDRKNESEVIQNSRSRKGIFIISIIVGNIGTILLILFNLALGILGSAFLIFSLYGFFMSFSSGVPAYFEMRSYQKYRGQTLLIFRSLSAKLTTMGAVMATIALLFTVTLISEGTGMLFNAMFQSRKEQTTCFDLFISSDAQDKEHFEDYLSYINANISEKDSMWYQIYQGEDLQVTDYIEANVDYWSEFDYDTIMKASDYSALRAMLGYTEIAMEPGQYFIHSMPYLKELLEDYTKAFTLGDQILMPGGVGTEIFTQSLWGGNGRGFILIVPDEAVAALPISHSIYAAMTEKPVSAASFDALCALRDEKELEVKNNDTLFSKADVAAENAAMYALAVFPLYYLALVLTLVSATILTIHQLSEAERYRLQFELLHKLGMERIEMKRVLGRQFAIYYVMPAIPPMLISIPFLLSLGSAFDPGTLAGPLQLIAIVGFTLLLFVFIYLLYILLAYTSLKRNVLPVNPG